jgi:hypothetical protein
VTDLDKRPDHSSTRNGGSRAHAHIFSR